MSNELVSEADPCNEDALGSLVDLTLRHSERDEFRKLLRA